jgi:2-oxoacid:acceptor oxidoreductase gamma subunit (pyruvate/2-ketoisovalerate family)
MQRLKFYGLGGQGVVTAAKTLSIAVSIYEDEYAITVPAYGHERRGAPVYTDMVIDKEPILVNCFVYEPDIVIVLDETIIEKHVDPGAGMHEGTILVLNTQSKDGAQLYQDKYGFKDVYYVDGTGFALKNIGRGIPNGSMLGALAKTGAVRIESVEKALKEVFGKAGDQNAKAARDAYENTQKI